MEQMFPSVAAIFLAGAAGFWFGTMVTKNPSEDTMMDRLVIAATQRRMLGVTKKVIEEKIETRVQANLNTVK